MRVINYWTTNKSKIFMGGLALLILVWFILGGPLYIIEPEEVGVILTFGRYTSTNTSGLHFKFPWPVQEVYKVPVNIIQRCEIGYRTISENPPEYISFTSNQEMLTEAEMLTGDENIIDCAVIVQYRINSATDYLFNVRDPKGTMRDISEASIRLVVGDNAIDAVLTTGKLDIQNRIKEEVQRIADDYGMGVYVVTVQLMDVQAPAQVSAAFKDVATAREDMQAYINEAEAYRNEMIPEAQGDSVSLVNNALGYATVRVNTAQGEANRFIAVAEEYRKNPEVTATRLHLETMSALLGTIPVTIVDESAGALTHYNLEGAVE